MKLYCTKHLAYRFGEKCARCGRTDPSPHYEDDSAEECEREATRLAIDLAQAFSDAENSAALGIAKGVVVMANALQLHAPYVPPVPCEEPLPSNQFNGLIVARNKRSLYFGQRSDGGHFLQYSSSRTLYQDRDSTGFPWSHKLLDAGLLKNGKVPDLPDGRVFWTCGGVPLWLAFFWWDRSGDSRPGSNSGFYVQGFSPNQRQAALDFACSQWPIVVSRQRFPLVLTERHIPKSG